MWWGGATQIVTSHSTCGTTHFDTIANSHLKIPSDAIYTPPSHDSLPLSFSLRSTLYDTASYTAPIYGVYLADATRTTQSLSADAAIASSKNSRCSTSHMVHGPSKAWTTSVRKGGTVTVRNRPGLFRTFTLLPFRFRPPALHSTVTPSSSTLAFCHRTSPHIPRPH